MPKYGRGGMSGNGGNITFGINFDVDNSSLKSLKTELQKLQHLTADSLVSSHGSADIDNQLNEIKKTATQVGDAIEKAFNPKLNSVNIAAFNKELKNQNLTIDQIATTWNKAGAAGASAFRNLEANILTTNLQLKNTNSIIDKMGTTLVNSFKWSIASSVVNNFTGAIEQAYGYIKHLDSSLNDIRIVTGQSAEQMADFAQKANDAAKSIGQTTTAFTNAALIYYQQGLDSKQADKLAGTTLKVANITGQATDTVSEEITAVMNGYQLGVDQVEGAFDKLAKVAATTASDLEEISTGMSKVASAANSMGVPLDSLNAQLATIVSVTRQAPQAVGTALKTIYSRLGDLEVDGQDEFGVTLGKVSSTMESMGIKILDETGNLRNMGDVITEVGEKWQSWTGAQRQAMAVAMAGKRQYNNLIALFDNWDMYTQALNTSMTAQGTIEEQNQIYLESLTAHTKQLQAAQEDLIDSFADTDSFKAVIDLGTKALTLIADFVDAIGGGGNALLLFGSILTRVFSKSIAGEINSVVSNIKGLFDTKNQLKAMQENLAGVQRGLAELGEGADPAATAIAKLVEQAIKLRDVISPEEANTIKAYADEINKLANVRDKLERRREKASDTAANIGVDIGDEQWQALQREVANRNDTFSFDGKGNTVDVHTLSSYNAIVNKLKELQEEYNATTNSAKNFSNTVSKVISKVVENGTIQVKLNPTITSEALQAVVNNLKAFINNAEAGGVRLNVDSTQFDAALEDAKNRLADLQTVLADGVSGDDLVGFIQAVSRAGDTLSALVNEGAAKGKAAIHQVEQTALDTVNTTTKSIDEKIKSLAKRAKATLNEAVSEKNIQNVLNLVSGIEQIAFGLQQVQTVVSAIQSGNLTNNLVSVISLVSSLGLGVISTTKAVAELGVSFSTALPIIGAITVGLTALVGVIEHQKQAREQILANNKALEESIEKKHEDTKATEKQIKAYTDLYEKYKTGKATKEEMASASSELTEILGSENVVVAKLTGNYAELTEKIKAAKQARIGQRESELEQLKTLYAGDIGLNNDKAKGVKNADNGAAYYKQFNAGFVYDAQSSKSIHSSAVASIVNQSKVLDWQQSPTDAHHAISFTVNKNDYDGLVQAYDDLVKIKQALIQQGDTSSDFFNSVNNYITTVTDSVTKYKGVVKELSDLDVQKTVQQIDFSKINSLSSFMQQRAKIIDTLKQKDEYSQASPQELRDAADQIIAATTDTANTFIEKAGLVEQVVAQKGESVRATVTQQIGALSDEEIAALQQFLTNNEITGDNFIDNISYYLSKAKQLVADNEIEVKITTAQDAMETLASGEAIDADKLAEIKEALGDSVDWEKFDLSTNIQQVEQLGEAIKKLNKERYDAYQNAVEQNERAIRSEEATTEKALDLQRELKNAQANLRESFLHGNGNGAPDEIAIAHWTEEVKRLKEQINSLPTDFPVQIDVDINDTLLTAMQDNVAGITLTMDSISTAAAMIGENFTVAADKVSTFSSLFPQLLANATVAADGTLQLNQAVVQDFLNGKNKTIEADTNATLAQLDNQIAVLKSEQQYHKTVIKNLKSALDGNISYDEAVTNIDQARAKYEQDLKNSLSKDEAEAVNKALGNDSIATNQKLFNLDEIGKRAAAVSKVTAAVLAGQAMDYTPGGQTARNKSGPVSGYTGTGVDNTPKDNALTKRQQDQFEAQLVDQEAQLADVIDKINKKQALKAIIQSNYNKYKTTSDNVGKGLGPDGKGKGGSGKQADTSQKKYLEYLDKQPNLYRAINRELDELNDKLSITQKLESKLSGSRLVANLDEQNKILDQQNQALAKKNKLETQELIDLQNNLKAVGATFNKQGELTNYEKVLAAAKKEYDKLVDDENKLNKKYNESTNSDYKKSIDEQIKKKHEQVETAKKAYDTIEKQIEEYDKKQKQIGDNTEKIIENTIKKYQNGVKKFNTGLDMIAKRLDKLKDAASSLKGDLLNAAIQSEQKLNKWAEKYQQQRINNLKSMNNSYASLLNKKGSGVKYDFSGGISNIQGLEQKVAEAEVAAQKARAKADASKSKKDKKAADAAQKKAKQAATVLKDATTYNLNLNEIAQAADKLTQYKKQQAEYTKDLAESSVAPLEKQADQLGKIASDLSGNALIENLTETNGVLGEIVDSLQEQSQAMKDHAQSLLDELEAQGKIKRLANGEYDFSTMSQANAADLAIVQDTTGKYSSKDKANAQKRIDDNLQLWLPKLYEALYYRGTAQELDNKAEENQDKINDNTRQMYEEATQNKIDEFKAAYDAESKLYEAKLKKIESYLNRIMKAADKFVGKSLVNALSMANEALMQKASLIQSRVSSAAAENAGFQSTLASYGATFNDAGVANNFAVTQAINKEVSEANNNIAKLINATDGLDHTAEIQAEYDRKANAQLAEAMMDQYDQNTSFIADADQQLADIQDQIEENKITAYNAELELKLDTHQFDKEFEDWRHKLVDDLKSDDILGKAQYTFSQLTSDYDAVGKDLTDKVTNLTGILNKINSGDFSTVYGSNQKQALADLENYTKQLMDVMEATKEKADELRQDYFDAIDQAKSAFDDQLGIFEQIDKLITHDVNLLKLVRPDNTEAQLKWYSQRQKNYQDELEFAKQEKEMWERLMNAAQKGSDEWKKFKSNWIAATNEMNDAVEKTVQNALDKYNTLVDKIITDGKNKMAPNGNWDAMKDEWDKAKWQNDRYMDALTRATQLSKFQTEARKAMQGLDPKQQKDLTTFMNHELDTLKDVTNLRKIDVDIANKKLDILRKQMALEDAQQAKTKMRLRRDSQGNYRYEYVADEDQLADKQQQLRDAIEELRQLEADDLTQTTEAVQSRVEEFWSKAKELSEKYYYDQDLLTNKLQQLYENYFGENGYITGLNVDYHRMQGQLMNTTGAEYATLLSTLGDQTKAFLGLDDGSAESDSIWASIQALMGEDGEVPTLLDAFVNDTFENNFKTKLTDSAREMLLGDQGIDTLWDTAMSDMAEQAYHLKDDIVLPAMDELMSANNDYQGTLEDVESTAGIVFEDIAQGIDDDIGKTQDLGYATEDLISKYENMISTLQQLANQAQQTVSALMEVISIANQAKQAIDATNNANLSPQIGSPNFSGGAGGGATTTTGGKGNKKKNPKKKDNKKPTNTQPSATTPTDTTPSGGDNSGDGGNGGGDKPQSNPGLGKKNINDIADKIAGNIWYSGDWLNNPTRRQNLIDQFGTEDANKIYDKVQSYFKYDSNGQTQVVKNWKNGNNFKKNDKYYEKFAPGYQFTGYDTGGYTGSWGPGGRLAMLHQKELVLNAGDTENALNALKVTNNIVAALGSAGASILEQLANQGQGIGRLSAPSAQTVPQNVTINADFPNVSDAEEIKTALNNLVNKASQMVSKNRRIY